ncbi:MAG: hypothetical protein IPH76_16870 [Xanthomonadales bacterium]|nr:hypothetical protein [Xanthomonadales bacterium]
MTVCREHVRAPTLPRDEVLSDPTRVHLSADGRCLLCYDAATQAGAIFDLLQQTWLVHSPITAEQWIRALVVADLRPQHVGAQEWRELAALAQGGADARH